MAWVGSGAPGSSVASVLQPSFFPSPFLPGPTQINQVVSHPSQPLTITAHDDRGIRFLDNRTGEAWAGRMGGVTCGPVPDEALPAACLPSGKCVHSMVAHLDAVTCLAVDPNGVFLMSGSK